MVPEEAVAEVRDEEGDGDLGVALHQVDDGTLLIQLPVLMLAKPVEALLLAGVEEQLEVVHPSAGRQVPPRRRASEMRRRLGQQLATIG